MRIAYFTPLNPQKSGISDYSEELLPHIAKYADIDIFVSDVEPSNKQIKSKFKIVKYAPPDPPEIDKYDALIYQVGNNPVYHKGIIETAAKHPGFIELHDFCLGYIFKDYIEKGRSEKFIGAMELENGEEGRELGERYLKGECGYPPFEDPLKFPLSKGVIDSAKGIIVHSKFVGNKVRKLNEKIPVGVIPHIFRKYQRSMTKESARRKLSLPADALIVASIGGIHPNRRLENALAAFRKLKEIKRDAVYLLVGEIAHPDYNPQKLVLDSGLSPSDVRITGRVPNIEDLEDYIIAADILVNLRHPTNGETSGVLIRAMGLGRPAIVSDAGWFSEIPDNCVFKIPVGLEETNLIFDYLKKFTSDKKLGEEMGVNAMRYVEGVCNPAIVSERYVLFISKVLKLGVMDEFVEGIGVRLKELATREEDEAVQIIANDLGQILLTKAAEEII